MHRDGFIKGVANGLKDSIEVARSMEFTDDQLLYYRKGMAAATKVILDLTSDAVPSSMYRIFPVENVPVPIEEPIQFYDHNRAVGECSTNNLVDEIWDKVSS